MSTRVRYHKGAWRRFHRHTLPTGWQINGHFGRLGIIINWWNKESMRRG